MKRLRKRTLLNVMVLAILVALAHACDLDLDICCLFCDERYDPWAGDNDRVRFIPSGYEGYAGCQSTSGLPELMVASHGRQTFFLSPQDEPLPEDLVVATPDMHILHAIHDETSDEITVYANRPGFGVVELYSDGDIWDQKRIGVAPVSFVQYEAPSAVLTGGALVLGLTDVFGESGPLFGTGFIQWSTSPESVLELVTEIDSLHVFMPSSPGAYRLLGDERVDGHTFVDHGITVFSPDDIDEFVLRTVYPPYEDHPTGPWVESPLEVRSPRVFSIILGARVMDGHVAPISHINIIWHIEGDTGIVALSEHVSGPTPWMPELTAHNPGETTLVADIPFLGENVRFDMIVDGY